MDCIVPDSITEIIRNAKDVDMELTEYIKLQYGEYLAVSGITIKGAYHIVVSPLYNFTIINWEKNGLPESTSIKLFFLEKLCPTMIRQHILDILINE